MNLALKQGDVFLTRGQGFISSAIRLFTRRIGESRSKVNHVGIIVSQDNIKKAMAVEALSSVKCHRLWNRYGPPVKDEVAVYRPINLDTEQIALVVNSAQGYVGRRYGFLKIIAHLLDWLLMGMYCFRRLTRMDKYPICSWVVAHAFKAVSKDFGVPAGAASPDDIWDFVTTNENKYLCVYPLRRLQE